MRTNLTSKSGILQKGLKLFLLLFFLKSSFAFSQTKNDYTEMVLLAPRLDETDINSIYRQLNAIDGVYFLGYHDTYKRLMIKYDSTVVKDINVIITAIEHLNSNVCTEYEFNESIREVVHDKLIIPEVRMAQLIAWYQPEKVPYLINKRNHLIRVKSYMQNRSRQEEIKMTRLPLNSTTANVAVSNEINKEQKPTIEDATIAFQKEKEREAEEVKVKVANTVVVENIVEEKVYTESSLIVEPHINTIIVKKIVSFEVNVPTYLSVINRHQSTLPFKYRDRNKFEDFLGAE
ncbi:MAG TPA: hypothetical protein PKH65_08470 [Bacteroidia bacterium]|nr:hypothetical protein [Bacteroidia bacterium]HNT80700.1 hypothetical protein [Bacteroidia bacterium]